MMKKIFSVMLLCATVLVTSCKDDDLGEGNGDGADRCRFYGVKNEVAVYYDGTELKEIVGPVSDGSMYPAMIGNDFYAVTSNGEFFKNGEAISKEGKISNDAKRITGICTIGNSFYITGSDAERKHHCWKDGAILITPEIGFSIPSNAICALGTDVFVVAVNSSSKEVVVYKNADKLTDFEVTSASIGGIASYNGKVYLSIANEDEGESHRYIYNGTTMVKEATVDGSQIYYFNAGGDALFTQVNTSNMDIFKNTDWITPITPLVSAPDGYETGGIVTAIGEGVDTYIYASASIEVDPSDPMEGTIERVYCWKNSAAPLRMAADTITALVHIPLK